MATSTKKVETTPPQDADGFIADHCEGVDKDYYREKSAANTAKHEAEKAAWDEAMRRSPTWGPWLQKQKSRQAYREKVDEEIAAKTDAFNKEHPWVKDKNWAADHAAPIHSKQGGMTNADFDEVFNNYLDKIKNHKF